MRRCHSHWRQFGENAAFVAAVSYVSPHREHWDSFRGSCAVWKRDQRKCIWKGWLHLPTTQSQSPLAAELDSCFHGSVRIASGGKLIWKQARKGRQLLGGLTRNPEGVGNGGVHWVLQPQQGSLIMGRVSWGLLQNRPPPAPRVLSSVSVLLEVSGCELMK